MIGYLKGQVVKQWSEMMIVESNGIGYQVLTPPDVWERALTGKEIVLFITTIVREEQLSLVGFVSLEDKLLFECLLKVRGVGPKLGLQLLSVLGASGIRTAVHHNDISLLARTPGVGKKTAQLLCLELSGRLSSPNDFPDRHQNSLISALTNLGFSHENVRSVVCSLPSHLKGFDARLKQALQQLGR